MSEGIKMAAPISINHLQNMLQRAVQTVQWTYIIYWKFCSLQRILIWGDGYYNGAIKTRKTVQLKEVSSEEASLQRSLQLRELYETLCAGEANHQTRRPSAALSPEDLTESEWFYLMCFSYYFPPAVGLPGRAYVKKHHVWLTGANEAESQTFSRAILAKSANIQTVVCIPLLDGVVELGTTDKVREDLGFIRRIFNFFNMSQEIQHPMHPPPKQALSEHSTSNPQTISSFRSADAIAAPPEEYIKISSTLVSNTQCNQIEEEDGDEDSSSGDLSDTALFNDVISSPLIQNPNALPESQTQTIDQMQLDDMDSYYHILRNKNQNQTGNHETMRMEESEYFGRLQIDTCNVPLSPQGMPSIHELAPEDTHYSEMVLITLQGQSSRCSIFSSATNCIHRSPHSAFFKWSSGGCSASDNLISVSSQRQLKYILFTVPFLHCKYSSVTSQKSSTFPKGGGTTQEEMVIGSANHVVAEQRREKLNERFIMLRSLVPFVTKMDKASILGDTIAYVKHLHNKVQELETHVKQLECTKENMMIKKKMRMDRGSGGGELKAVTGNEEEAVQVEVSIIENDALVEVRCRHREGLLLDIMQMLRKFRVEIIAVQSTLFKGFFMAELRAKVKENLNGKKVTIMEVKKAILQTVSLQVH